MRPLILTQKNQAMISSLWPTTAKNQQINYEILTMHTSTGVCLAQDINAGDNMDKRKSVYLLLVWLSLSWPGSADKLQVM